jgi:universal stress protein A
MSIHQGLLCPVDFSDSSRGALHYALAIARRFHATLTVLTVDEPLLADVGDTRMGEGWSAANTGRQLRSFVEEARGDFGPVDVTYEVRIGKAAPAIVDLSRAPGTQLIVMSTHGRSGIRKLLFGATAERVLRETAVPVLLVPSDPGPLSFEVLAKKASPMLVPVDFSSATAHQVRVAAAIAGALSLRVLIGHVLEPIDLPVPDQIDAAELVSERHRHGCQGLQSLALDSPMSLAPQMLITAGDPAREIAQWVRDKHVGLLVMALHSDANGGPRMGAVTYRAIAMTGVLTLALPPAWSPQAIAPVLPEPRAEDIHGISIQ